jgi:hypothetical protein
MTKYLSAGEGAKRAECKIVQIIFIVKDCGKGFAGAKLIYLQPSITSPTTLGLVVTRLGRKPPLAVSSADSTSLRSSIPARNVRRHIPYLHQQELCAKTKRTPFREFFLFSCWWRLMNDVRTFLDESKDGAQINGLMECVKTFEPQVV